MLINTVHIIDIIELIHVWYKLVYYHIGHMLINNLYTQILRNTVIIHNVFPINVDFELI